MWSLLVFAVIGLLAGAAARMYYPGPQPVRVPGTLVLGVVGALAGGMVSWACWPLHDGLQVGNGLLAFFGSVVVLVLWSVWSYLRGLSNSRGTSP
jgi:uncharacterized membrane protein YeaQ/YmgE (transglycosylase-associated protein family)